MVLAISIILVVSGICFFFIFFRRGPMTAEELEARHAVKASAKSSDGKTTGTGIDLSAFDEICERDGEVDFWPLPGNDYQSIKELLEQEKPITPALLNRNKPIKIAYTDNKHVKTIREIIPFRIIGSIDKSGDQVEYDFYVEAFCLMRNGERSFHTNGISAAWVNGKAANLGDYLADLYENTAKKQ